MSLIGFVNIFGMIQRRGPKAAADGQVFILRGFGKEQGFSSSGMESQDATEAIKVVHDGEAKNGSGMSKCRLHGGYSSNAAKVVLRFVHERLVKVWNRHESGLLEGDRSRVPHKAQDQTPSSKRPTIRCDDVPTRPTNVPTMRRK